MAIISSISPSISIDIVSWNTVVYILTILINMNIAALVSAVNSVIHENTGNMQDSLIHVDIARNNT
jgi:hypothetical protein